MEKSALIDNEKSSHKLRELKDLEAGIQEDGDLGASVSPPDGFDMAKFNRGRQFFRDNLFSCCTGMFYALIIGLCYPDFFKTLIHTNNSETPRKAHERYVNTFKHIASWHYGNVWEEGSKAQESVLVVRRIHKKVRTEMARSGRGHFLSQYNMALVQSTFIAFPVVHTRRFGIKCSQASLDDYVYFWYGIGHLLGIESKYNICSQGLEQAKSFCENIQDEIFNPHLRNPGEEFYALSRALIAGWRKYILGTLSVPFVINFFQGLTNQTRKRLGCVDKIRSVFWSILFAAVRNMVCFKKLVNAGIEIEFGLSFSEFVV